VSGLYSSFQDSTSGYGMPVLVGAGIGYLTEKKTGAIVGGLLGAFFRWAWGQAEPTVMPIVEAVTPAGTSGFTDEFSWNPTMGEGDTTMDRAAFRTLQLIFLVGATTLAVKVGSKLMKRKANRRRARNGTTDLHTLMREAGEAGDQGTVDLVRRALGERYSIASHWSGRNSHFDGDGYGSLAQVRKLLGGVWVKGDGVWFVYADRSDARRDRTGSAPHLTTAVVTDHGSGSRADALSQLRASKPRKANRRRANGTTDLTKPMTNGEIGTLRTILRFGGKVFVSMGKKRASWDVRTSTINSLKRRGYIRLWTQPKRVVTRFGYRYDTLHILPTRDDPSDYYLTAAGVRALNQVDDDAAEAEFDNHPSRLKQNING